MQPLWMLAASFAFAVMAAIVKLCADDIGTMALVAWRGAIGMVVIWAWAWYTGRSIYTNKVWGQVKRSILGSLSLCMWFYAVGLLPLSTGMTLNYTSPIFMALFVMVIAAWRKQNVPWFLGFTAVVGFVGVILVLRPDVANSDLLAGIVGAASGGVSALAYIQIRQLADLHEPDWRIVFYFVSSNIPFGIAGHLLWEPASVYTWQSLTATLAVGITATLGQVFMTKAFGGGNMILNSLFGYSGILFACLFGIVLYGESLTLISILGIAVIIASGVAASLYNRKHAHA